MMKTYYDMIKLPTFEERYEYCKLDPAEVGGTTFADERFLNQKLYHSPEWQRVKRDVIARDEGCDLAFPDRPIIKRIYIHHLNPITAEDILKRRESIFDLDNLVCVSFDTHNAIHYGSERLLIPSKPTERTPNDTCPWKK